MQAGICLKIMRTRACFKRVRHGALGGRRQWREKNGEEDIPEELLLVWPQITPGVPPERQACPDQRTAGSSSKAGR